METENTDSLNWLLLRGLAREKRHWGQFPKILEKKSQGRVVTLDLPGVGERLTEKAPLKIEDYTETLREAWQKHQRKTPGKWGLVAISLGGMIAMDWLSRYPQDFTSLTLMNTSATNVCGTFERLKPQALKTFLKLMANKDIDNREEEILKLTTHLVDVNQTLVKKWANFQRDSPVSRETFLRQIFAASRYKAPKSLSLKPLILVSESDQLAASDCSKKLAKYFQVPYHPHLTAGHDLPLDDPQWVVKRILDHINGIDK